MTDNPRPARCRAASLTEQLEPDMEFLITIALFVVVGGGACVVIFKCLSSAATAHIADSEPDLEEAKAERLEAEGDALRLRMLYEKRARKQQQAQPPAPTEPAPAPQPQIVFVMPPDAEPERPRVRVIPRPALPARASGTTSDS